MKRVELGEIAEVFGGYAFKSKDFIEKPSVPVIKISNIQNGKVPEKKLKDFLPNEYLEKYGNYEIKKGDILVALSGATTGKTGTYLLSRKSLLNQRVGLVRAIDNLADQKYLSYYVSKITDDILRKAQGVAQPNISTKELSMFKIPLPSLSEQKAIVAKLDRAQRLVNIDREMLAKYDELIQSVFLEMFGDPVRNEKGWELEKLGDLCGVGSSKRVYVKELVEEGIPFYRGQEIGKLSEGKALEPELFVTEEHYQQLIDHSGKPEIGDLLMPSICPDGRIFIVKNNEKFYFKDGRVLWVKAGQSEINSFYLRYHLKALFQANYSEIASGTTFAELKIFALKKLQILNPPIELQERFQSEIERINQDIYRTKSSLKKSEDLFSSLVQGVFS